MNNADLLAIATKQTMPSGVTLPFAGASAPQGWLICDGSLVSRTLYSSLFTAIGTTWGVGDGSTTFNLPDMREATPCGTGTRGAGVTAHDAYTLGEFKDDQVQSHKHENGAQCPSGQFGTGGTYGGGLTYSAGTSGATNLTNNPHTGARSGTVNRGKRVGINYIIKV